MANLWGCNPIVLDTANDETSYNSASDVKNGGGKYSTLRYKIKKIQVTGAANGNGVLVKQCSQSEMDGPPIVVLSLETGDLNKHVDFGEGIWVNGINPDTLDGNCEILIHLA